MTPRDICGEAGYIYSMKDARMIISIDNLGACRCGKDVATDAAVMRADESGIIVPASCGGLFSRKLHGCDIVISRSNTFIDRIQARFMGTSEKRG
jgi:hypothetical protein